VRGRAARIAGFFLTIPLILGIVTLPVFEPTLGIYDQRARVLMPLLAAISILVGAVLAFRQRANATIEA
jgi:ACR3 family arsenite efflux pump ArsB